MIRCAVVGGTSKAILRASIAQTIEEISGVLSRCNAHIFTCGSGRGIIGYFLDCSQNTQPPPTAIVLLGKEEQRIHPTAEAPLLMQTATQRKEFFLANVDVLIAFPGGFGTHDEIFAFATAGRQVFLINADNFFFPLLVQIALMKRQHFISPSQAECIVGIQSPLEFEKAILELVHKMG